MSKTQHTPGPWEYDTELADAGNKSTPIYTEAPGADADLFEAVCIIPHDDITAAGYTQIKANARLIAAAPDLLDALKEILDNAIVPYRGPMFDKARAAIAKATGERI